MDSFFDRALLAARRLGASDVHLKPGQPPILRIKGELRTLSDVPALSRDFLHSIAMSMLSDRRRETLERIGDVTVSLATAAGRQRIQIFQQRGGTGIALRLIPPEVPTLETLGIPAEARELTRPGAGLVLIAAPPGNGKTTTLAALLDDLGTERPCQILTIEDPVEHLLKDRRSVVVQREVGTDVPSVATALRAAVRQDADLLAVGDLRDFEAAEAAVSAVECGQLVLAGIAAGGTAQAIARLTSFWPPGARLETRARVVGALRGVVFQRLVISADGKRRVAAGELLRVQPETRARLLDPAAAPPSESDRLSGTTSFEPPQRPTRARQAAAAEEQAAVEDEPEPD
jgi:twitching motility protein PilT